MPELWNQSIEKDFFLKSKDFASTEQLFYKSDDNNFYAYWPKSYKGSKTTLQSRNALIGSYTETWSQNLLQHYANNQNLFAVQGIICKEIGLTNQSNGDLALCITNKKNQIPEDIVLLFEIKMSVVWNWQLKNINDYNSLICIGDYKTHKGTPGLLRSDSMLKAIGKSINIRVSSFKGSRIPIVVLGNTPITQNYYEKVDFLKKNGVIQGFWSLNPNPITGGIGLRDNIKTTKFEGFYRFDNLEEVENKLDVLINEELEFFSSMKSKNDLGEIIEIANKEATYELKGEKFLELLRSG